MSGVPGVLKVPDPPDGSGPQSAPGEAGAARVLDLSGLPGVLDVPRAPAVPGAARRQRTASAARTRR
ncbi:hypothetical protein OHB01_27075 [Microbispora hainanensis]|uniref:hypothetical protein n=1 Tax=Microbispora hainanensis TaxID=568844 RepID=UPI002E29AE60|nr:hypothetical protein [Microbispora hainanensis]